MMLVLPVAPRQQPVGIFHRQAELWSGLEMSGRHSIPSGPEEDGERGDGKGTGGRDGGEKGATRRGEEWRDTIL